MSSSKLGAAEASASGAGPRCSPTREIFERVGMERFLAFADEVERALDRGLAAPNLKVTS